MQDTGFLPATTDGSSEASMPWDQPNSGSDEIPNMTVAPSPTGSANEPLRRIPSLRTSSDPQVMVSTPSVSLNSHLSSARRPVPSANNLPQDLMQKARAFHQSRMSMGSRPSPCDQVSGRFSNNQRFGATGSHMMGNHLGASCLAGGPVAGGAPVNLQLPSGMVRPSPVGFTNSAPVVPSLANKKPPSLSERRAVRLGALPGTATPGAGPPKLSDITGSAEADQPMLNGAGQGTSLNDFKKYIDVEKGWITFEGAATITQTGVNFASGEVFHMSIDQTEELGILGSGNYGVVKKVRHVKPAMGYLRAPAGTGKIMAMKEVRLGLEESKFTTILKELVILHECVSPYIIDFYGAFFQNGSVYMCIEYMDGGSIDKLYAGGIPEQALRKITYSTVMGLKTLKDDHNIIHRDVKPTNILVNTKGQVKICDFGVSGHLVASLARTSIGCQSYMAPERIKGTNMGAYSVQSDIWSLGLTILECALGQYPFGPDKSKGIMDQLVAILKSKPPELPEGYTDGARHFVKSCLANEAEKRPTYAELLKEDWIEALNRPTTVKEDAEGEAAAAENELANAAGNLILDSHRGDSVVAQWVKAALAIISDGPAQSTKPALHSADPNLVNAKLASLAR